MLLGAEVNAFFAEGIGATPYNLAVMVHRFTSHLQTSEKDIQEQALPSHKNVEPKAILPKSEIKSLKARASRADQADNTQTQSTSSTTNNEDHRRENRNASSRGSSGALTIVEVAMGTSLALLVQLFRLRRKK